MWIWQGNAAEQLVWQFYSAEDTIDPVVDIVSPMAGSPAYEARDGVLTVGLYLDEPNLKHLMLQAEQGSAVIGTMEVTMPDSFTGPGGITTTVQISLDGSIGDGLYDLRVIAVDQAGNTGMDSESAALVIDTQAPAIYNGIPAGGSLTNTATPLITASLLDPGLSGLDLSSDSLVFMFDGVTYTANIDSGVTGDLAATVSWQPPALREGSHDVVISVKDRSGNSGSSAELEFHGTDFCTVCKCDQSFGKQHCKWPAE